MAKLSMIDAAFIREAALRTVLSSYFTYLMETKKIPTRKAGMEALGTLVSKLMDNGECSSATMVAMEQLTAEIPLESRKTLLALQQEQIDTTIDATLTNLVKIATPDDCGPDLKGALILYTKSATALDEAKARVRQVIQNSVMTEANGLLKQYAPLFDSAFVKQAELVVPSLT